jgi:hypothetical protein
VRQCCRGAITAKIALGEQLELLVICMARDRTGGADTATLRVARAGQAKKYGLPEWAKTICAVLEVVWEG